MDDDPARDVIWSHAGAYARHPHIQVTAVCDPDPQRLEGYRRRYGFVREYRDYQEMLAVEDLDLVSVCTPTASHCEIVRRAATGGLVKGIFCEKPMAFAEETARSMTETCRSRGVVLAVNYMRRWDPTYLAAKSLVESGRLGELRTITAYGATALLTSTSHLIDLMLMFGGMPEWVCGDLQEDYVREVQGRKDPGGVALFKFRNDVHGFLKGTSASSVHYMFEFDILLTEGRIAIGEDGRSFRAYRFEQGETPTGSGYMSLVPISDLPPPPRGERMLAALDDILDCMETGGLARSSGDTAGDVLHVIEGVKASDALGSTPIAL